MIAEKGCLLLLERLPDHALIPIDELRESIRVSVRAGFDAVNENRRATPGERRMLAGIGAHRASYGMPLQTLVRGFRLVAAYAADVAAQHARDLGVDMSRFTARSRLWHWVMEGLELAAAEHRRVELEMVRADLDQRSSFLRDLLAGSLSGARLAEAAAANGLDPEARYLAFRIPPSAGRLRLEQAANEIGFAAAHQGDIAGLVPRLPLSFRNGPLVALGRIAPLDAAAASFSQAALTLRVARALGMSGAVSIADVPVQAAVLTGGDLTDLVIDRCFGEIPKTGRHREVIENTLRVYLDHDLHVADAARALHIHPNTLRHRLNRFEERSGLSLERLTDLVTVWWTLQHLRITAAEP
ncbi:helix-turn-helix domain-containing protein [Actinocorallia longicatena]|uniref:Helix-turn-helix domain-containing protein n=2 Tax=Actinocorallia longicatena TaxID=111803 RepID=A0ABP6QHW5_9ACTN